MRHYDLHGILTSNALFSDDGSEFIDAQDPEKMWVRTVRRVYGGGNSFFGEALMLWHYTFRRPKDW